MHPSRTLGGMQLWADVHHFRDWRIQTNVLTRQYRLLDGDNRRHAGGTEAECRSKLDRFAKESGLVPWGGKAVLLLHGIGRTRNSLVSLARHLESAGYSVYRVGYPSTRLTIEEHAKHLHCIVSGLSQAEEIHFVTHSMGGLVVRAYLAKHSDPRIGRLVMVGTPNQGAIRADAWKENLAYRIVMGPAGQQLVTGPDGIVASLPPKPGIEFGILAGGKGDGKGYSSKIPGDDDGTVSVESTHLQGARDFALVHCRHTFLMDSKEVHRLAVSFLDKGYFHSKKASRPIEATNVKGK